MQIHDYFDEFARRDWDSGADGTVRFAIVGVGGFARKAALPALADADYAEATVLVTSSPEKVEDAAENHDIDHVLTYDEYHDGAATDAYDAVYVVTPNALHPEAIETAAEHDKAVLSEKPLAATVEGAERAVDACESADVPLMTAYRMQFDPVVRRLREYIRDGGIGDTLQLDGGFAFDVMGGSRGPDQWRLDAELAGGGALMDVGVYPLNTARYLVDADPVAVTATMRGEGVFADVDEHIAFQLEFPDGVTASFTAGFSGYTKSHLSIRGTEGHVELSGSAFGTEDPRRVTVHRNRVRTVVDGPGTSEIREEFDYFAHAVLTGEEIGPDGEEGLRDVRVTTAAYEAAETGERVEIRYS
ncbi:oxidoreductase [Haloprofundus marisrubri]|uniref:Oxidoreductase n=1 Tax=Haloprofundus marisrubri TaxID=1514971 RepID=A0A0W1RB32_9EURY|nr:D-xylose 1-dehydrogenase Gfo6 [Haloprofundus marisrubri]KTG10303.1 oxidoreductase [Haloprofundus marisrubri]